MGTLNIFSANPYSPALVLGLVFFMLAAVNFEVMFRTKVSYFMWMGFAMLAASVAWGTTDLQDVGKVYINWQWWWAQPFFTLTSIGMCVGIVQYLPLPPTTRSTLLRFAVWPPVMYLVVCTLLLTLEVPIVRAYAVIALLPPIIAISYACFRSESIEPGRGHRLIGLLGILNPIVTLSFPLLGLTTAISRFWTGLPLVMMSVTILATSLLREREKLEKNVAMLHEAEKELTELNEDLEQRVVDRTEMLQEVIADLETFNRNVSHDIRSPLGSIGMMALIARKHLEAGKPELARAELDHISEQTQSAQQMVTTMLSLASRLEADPKRYQVDLGRLALERVDALRHGLHRKHPDQPLPRIEVHPLPVLETDPGLMRIILDNLLDNAVKHNHGRADLRIDIGIGLHAGTPCLYVRDNGVGLGGADDAIVLGASRAHSYGFGLNIVERAVRRLGGQLDSTSGGTGGASFYVSLPGLQVPGPAASA